MPCKKLSSGKWQYGEHGQEYDTEEACMAVQSAVHASKDYFMQESFDAETHIMTDEGFMITRGRMARTGVQSYRAIEISQDLYPDDPLKVIRVYRPHSEVFDQASMRSFENKPVTLGHPVGTLVNADNWKDLAKGEVRDVKRQGDLMIGTLIIKDAEAIASIKAGTVQLSNGYTNDLEFNPGTTPTGETYDAIQRHIRGNHVALVTRARCGEQCSIINDGGSKMAGDTVVKITVDGMPLEVNEVAAAAIQKLQGLTSDSAKQLAAVSDKLTGAQKSLDEHKAKVTDLEAKLVKAQDPATLATAVKDWAGMVLDGEKVVAGFKPENVSSCVEYKRALVTKAVEANDSFKPMVEAVLGGKTLVDASADGVQTAFRLLVSMAPKSNETTVSHDDGLGKAFLTADQTNAPVGMALFHQRMKGGFADKGDK